MNDKDKTKEQLLDEVAKLRSRVAESEKTESDNKQAEKALRESEKLLRTIADNYPNSYVSIIKNDFTTGFTSGQEFKKQNLNPNDFIGLPLDKIFGEHWAFVKEQYSKVFAGEETSFELFINDQYQHYRAVPLYSESGSIDRILAVVENITDRKQAEESIQQQQYYLEKSQELGKIGTWELDLKENILRWTDENCRIFGIPPGSVVDYEIFISKVHPDDREYVDREWMAGVAGKPYDIEHRLLIDGVTTWVREKADVTFDENGVAVSAIGFTQDITERRRAEQTLQQTSAFLQAAMDCSPAGIAIADAPSGKLRYVNDAALGIRGGTKEELVNGIGIDQYVASWQILHFDGTPFKDDEVPLARAIMYGETCDKQFILRKKDHEDRVVWAHAAPIFDDNGNVIAGIVVFPDITERKRAEEALRESEARHMSMVANISDVIGIIGVDGFMTYKSPNIEKWFGWKPQDLVGTDGWLTVHPDDLERIQKEFKTLLEKDKPATTVEYRYKCKDGNYDGLVKSPFHPQPDENIAKIFIFSSLFC